MFLSRGKKGGSANKKGLGWVSEEIIQMNPKEMDSFSNEMRKEGFELRATQSRLGTAQVGRIIGKLIGIRCGATGKTCGK